MSMARGHLVNKLLHLSLLQTAINRVMPQDGNSQNSVSHNTDDVEMIDEDISVITPKTHPPGM